MFYNILITLQDEPQQFLHQVTMSKTKQNTSLAFTMKIM